MSIINDALKKTQSNLAQTQKTSNEEPIEKTPSEPTDRAAEPWETKPIPPKSPLPPPQKAFTPPTPPAPPPKKIQGEPAPQRSPGRTIAHRILLFLVISVCIYLTVVLLQFLKMLNTSSQPATIAPPPAEAQKPATPAAPPRDPDTLILGGIVTISGRQYALINDEIYAVGDFIDGKQVATINNNRVEIRDGEKLSVLTLE